MLQDALHAEGHALEGYRVLVVQRGFVATPPVREVLEAQGAEIVGPASGLAAALRLAGCEPIDAVVLDAEPEDAGPLTLLLAAEHVPLVPLAAAGSALPPGAGMHDLVGRLLNALES